MRIQHNIASMNAYSKLSGNNNALSDNLEKLSSGFQINRAADDAAGLGISEKMRAQITGLQTAQKNAKDGISVVQTAEGALTEVHSMLNRMVELATQSANGIYSSDERTKIKNEVTALTDEINRITKHTDFDGKMLLDGTFQNITLQIGDTAEQVLSVDIIDLSTTGANMGLNNIINTIENGDNSAIATIKAAIETVSATRGILGATQNRLDHTLNNLNVTTENLTEAESRIRDTDMAEQMMKYTKNNILVQASQSMLAQANQIPQGVLQLLQ